MPSQRGAETRDEFGPARARVVIIGAGIVGNSMAWHLARLGWRDIVLLEKGMLPNPGGSTGHASNFIFLTDHSKEMAAFTIDSARQYRELGVYDETGGIEVARTPERMEELKRRMASSTSWGVEGSRLLTPAEVKEMVPFIEETVILGGFYTPGVGIVDSLQAGTLMRQKAQEMGALTVARRASRSPASTSRPAASARVHTDAGTIEAEVVVIACGVWSPRIAKMAGASIPLTPAVHQMIDIGPVPMFEHTTREVGYPIVRDMDTNMYERQHGTGFEIGSYAHRAILMDADDIPSIAASALSPTMLPFTQEDFDPQLEDSLELFPEIVGDESVGVKLAINGLLSLTPDGNPIIGETPEVKGLWSVAAIWIKEAPGIAKTVAEWMTNGEPEIDPHGSDIARFYDHHKTRPAHRRPDDRGLQQDLRHRPPDGAMGLEPADPPVAGLRPPRRAGRRVLRGGRLGAPVLVRRRTSPCSASTATGSCRGTAEWESRWWSPIINAEHLAMRDRAAWSTCPRSRSSTSPGPAALRGPRAALRQQGRRRRRRTVYTPLLNPAGGILADLTIMRLAHDRFRVVTGGGMGMRDRKLFQDALPADGSAQLHDATNAFTTFGLWGPRARDILGAASDGRRTSATPASRSLRRSRSTSTASGRSPRGSATSASSAGRSTSRSSRAGASGTRSGGPASRTASCRSGSARTRVTSRLEKGYRAHGAELELDFDLVEAGMARPTLKDADFVGRAAYERQRAATPAAILCTLTVDDPTLVDRRQALHARPRADPDASTAQPIVDAKGRRSYVTSRGLRAVGREAPPDDLPAAGARRRSATRSSSSTSASAIR